MPKAAVAVPDSYLSITRPVALEAVRQLAMLMGWQSTIEILFPGDAEEVAMNGSTLDPERTMPSNFSDNGRIRIEIVENPIEDRVLATAIHRRENLPVFLDKKLGIRFQPVYSGTELVFQLQFRAPNRVLAERFRQEALMKTAQYRRENLHELTYHYAFPPVLLMMLKSFHELREATAGYNETFDVWVSNHITAKATNLATLIGTQQQLSVGETQTCPLGWFDFTALPEPATKNDETGTYVLNFQYTLQYDKVIGIAAEWPLMVHNQIIDSQYYAVPLASGNMIDPGKVRRKPALSRHAFDALTNVYTDNCFKKFDGISIPEFDEWAPASVPPDTSTIIAAMISLDPNDLRAVADLDDLGDIEIDPDIRNWMRTEGNRMTRYGESVFHISLYRGDVQIDDGILTIDNQLNIRATVDLNLRERYHLRVAVLHNIFSIQPEGRESLRNAGQAAVKILTSMQLRLMKTGFVPDLTTGGSIPRNIFRQIGQRINDLKVPHRIGVEYRFLTVGNYIIRTNREEQNAYRNSAATDAADNPAAGDPGAGTDGGTVVSRCDG